MSSCSIYWISISFEEKKIGCGLACSVCVSVYVCQYVSIYGTCIYGIRARGPKQDIEFAGFSYDLVDN